MLLVLACLAIQAFSSTAVATAAPAKHARSTHGALTSAARMLPPALKQTSRRSRTADRVLVARAKGVKRCLRANSRHPNRCKGARRALQRAGVRLARIESHLAQLARAGGRNANGPAATASRSGSRNGSRNARQAPVLTVTGQKLSWNRVANMNTYVLVIMAPNRAAQYSVVSGIALTPPPVPGATVKYSVRTSAEGSAWAIEKSISYPAAKAPAPKAPEVKTPETPKTEEKAKTPEEKAETPVTTKKPEEVTAPEKVDTQAAPELKVSGQKLVWNPLAGVSTYMLVTKVPGKTEAFSEVSGVSVTPPAVPGTTVKYSVRTAVEGSAWSPEVSITYAAAVTPPPTPTPPVTTTPSGVIIGVNDGSGWGPEDAHKFIALGITSERTGSASQDAYSAEQGFQNDTVIVGDTNDSSPLSSVNTASWTSSALEEVKAAVSHGDTLLEVGNEMYLKANGNGNGEEVKYGEMYVSLANAVKSAGIKATLMFNSFGAGWISGAIKAQPSLKTLIDAFSNHPYGLANENSSGKWGPGAMEAMHAEAVSLGVVNTNFYITEFGVEDGIGPKPQVGSSGPAQQAERIKAVFTELIGTGYVKGIWYYQTHDDSTGKWGLIEPQASGSSPFIARPSLTVVAAFAKEQGS